MARILIVDDESQIRALLRRLLEGAGHRVEEAADGDEGAALLEANGSDLVITDIVMPGQEGLGFIRNMRRTYPDTKIIAISGGGRIGADAYLPLAQDLGAVRTFSKPFKNAELLEAIEELLAE